MNKSRDSNCCSSVSHVWAGRGDHGAALFMVCDERSQPRPRPSPALRRIQAKVAAGGCGCGYLLLAGGHELVGAADVVLAQLHQQARQEPGLAVGRGQHVPVRDQNTATLVLREQPQPRALLHQHLHTSTNHSSVLVLSTNHSSLCPPATASPRTWTSPRRRSWRCPGPAAAAPRSLNTVVRTIPTPALSVVTNLTFSIIPWLSCCPRLSRGRSGCCSCGRGCGGCSCSC